MTHLFRLFVPALLLTLSPLALRAQELTPPDPWTGAASRFVEHLRDGAFDDASAAVLPPLAAGPMGPAELRSIWTQISAQLGPLHEFRPHRLSVQGEQRLVELLARFELQELILLVPVDGEGRVMGLQLLPASAGAYRVPEYVDETAFEERALAIGSPPWTLEATLTLPVNAGEGPFPAIVLVHGSGPNDRDQTVGPNRPFRDLAWGLASRGIAVLRYEKRTRALGHLVDPVSITLDEEVIDDALAALEALRGVPEVDERRLAVVGHSLGATLTPVIATRDGQLAGAVLLAPMARPFADVLEDQLGYLAPLQATTPEAQAQFDEALARIEAFRAGQLPDTARVLGAPVRYIHELDDLRVTMVASELDIPLLVVQGERDYQVTLADFALWEGALASRPNALLRGYPELDHLLVAGVGPSTPDAYMQEGRSVDSGLVGDLAEWILGLQAREAGR